jgi:membrane protease YdiL (CAAX protease family)
VSDGVALWLRIAAITVVSAVLLIALAPDRPPSRVPWPAAVALGTCAGLVLFGAITHARPRLPPAPSSASVAFGKLALLGLWATNEEVVWRRVALGELLRAGVLPALLASSVGFALMHRTRRGIHLGTGGTFGALYLSTGALAASVAAHWTYNVLVGGFVAGHRRGTMARP